MRTGKCSTNFRRWGMRPLPAAALAASLLGMLAVAGCSSQATGNAPEQPVPATFALERCTQIQPNLYKCPALDKPLCTPQYNRSDVNCVRVGPKGSVFVKRGGLGM
jgi:hypothetical protein